MSPDCFDICVEIGRYIFVVISLIAIFIGIPAYIIWAIDSVVQYYKAYFQELKAKEAQRSKLKNSSTCDAGSFSHKE